MTKFRLYIILLLISSCNIKDENVDNILNVNTIKNIQEKALSIQEPYYYYSYLASIDTNSYYLNSEIAYYTKDDNILDEIKSKFKDVNNTFTISIQAIGVDIDTSIQLLKKSINLDKYHLNRVAHRMLLYNYVMLNDSIKVLGFISKLQNSSMKDDIEINLIWANYLLNKGETLNVINNLIDYSNKYRVKNFEIENLIGESFIRLGKYNEAEKHIKNAINLLNRNDNSHYLMSVINIEKKDFHTAKINIEKAIKLKNDNYLYYWQLASLTQESNGNIELIYKNYDLALRYCKTDDYFTILNNLFSFLINNGEFKKLDYQYHLNIKRSNDEVHNSIYDLIFIFYVENKFEILNKKYDDLINKYPADQAYIDDLILYFNIKIQKINQKT